MEFQPNIVWGGRIVALTKDPSNDNKIIAAAPSGGIFISNSKGDSWTHVNLPVFEMVDVKFSTNSDIVIATSARDLKVNNGGGIWRSTNGGQSWTKPPSSVFIMDGSPVASHGYGISFEPGKSARVYVGTENGVAISNDNGAVWTYNPIAPGFQIKVYCVLAAANGVAIAATSDGIYRTIDGGNKWALVSSVRATTSTRCLCFSPRNNNNVFLAADGYTLYYSGDLGKTWGEIKSPGGKNREPFIRCTAQPSNFFGKNILVTFLYYGNGVDLYRKILPNAETNSGNVDFGNGWAIVGVDHTDPSDIVFDNAGNSLLLSGDGGVLNTTDGGNNWHMTGSGVKGLNALQINEAAVQENFENGKKNYIYFGTQDNNLWASLDGGGTWAAFGNEGHSLGIKRRAIMSKGNLMVLTLDDSVSHYGSGQGWAGAADWKEVPARAGDPMIVPEGGDLLDPEPRDRFVQLSFSKGFFDPRVGIKLDRYNFNNTYNGGGTWNKIGQMSYAPTAQYPKISSSGEPVMYQPYFTSETTKNGFSKVGLMRLTKTNRVGLGVLERADGNGFGSLGTFPTEFKWYNVFAVHPTNPEHVIIADIESSEIKVSKDGGKNWYAETALTYLITDGGKIEFYKIVDCCPKMLVTCMSFNPDNPNEIAIGTRENGIFFSWDGGSIWYKLDNTVQITNASSISFYFDGSILVSTYGRGLWKFKPKKSKLSTETLVIKDKFKGFYIFETATGKISGLGSLDSAGIGKDDQMITVNTADKGLTLKKISEQALRTIETSPDSSNRFQQTLRLTFPDQQVFSERFRQLANDPIVDIPIRAFVYDKQNRIISFVISQESYKVYRADEVLMQTNTNPDIHLLNDSLEAVSVLMQNKSYYIEGVNFNPVGGAVQIYIAGNLIDAKVTVSTEGTFHAKFVLDQKFGNGVEIRVKQDTPSGPVNLIRNIPLIRDFENIDYRKANKNE